MEIFFYGVREFILVGGPCCQLVVGQVESVVFQSDVFFLVVIFDIEGCGDFIGYGFIGFFIEFMVNDGLLVVKDWFVGQWGFDGWVFLLGGVLD